MNFAKILIVDDETDITEFLQYNLKKSNFLTKIANDGLQAIELYKSFKPNIIILDIMMPRLNGVEICEKIRSHYKDQDVIIIFLSARNEEYTQVACYDSGGDDYIQKPIKPRLLIKKIESYTKRIKKLNLDGVIKNGISINKAKHLIFLNEKKINLTKTQFKILNFLFKNENIVFSREQIIEKVWGENYYVSQRNVDVQIRKIRKQIGEEKIVTIKGVGYKFTV